MFFERIMIYTAAYVLDQGSNNSELSDILTVCEVAEKNLSL